MKLSLCSVFLVLPLAAIVGCASTPEVAQKSEWLAPSPSLAQRIDDQVRRLPWTHGEDRVELIHWFAKVGEPAYSRLLEVCLDSRPDVASSAVAALGASGDSRLVDPLNDLAWPETLHPQVRYERARALLRLGDWRQVGDLVDGLEADALWTRAWCAKALQEVTRQSFGYNPQGDASSRAQAVAQWRRWMRARADEGILVSKG